MLLYGLCLWRVCVGFVFNECASVLGGVFCGVVWCACFACVCFCMRVVLMLCVFGV